MFVLYKYEWKKVYMLITQGILEVGFITIKTMDTCRLLSKPWKIHGHIANGKKKHMNS